ncbi:MAG: NAD(P)H-hydrate dehydratase [Candidatus Omnitrophica bacterium]|nr:NAD(P)H-hydrate dehydratase [Candidatus Omnitrophota bacterium]
MQLPPRLYKRNPDTHKGNYGHVFVIGGSAGMTGAVCLAANAALRVGAGLVTVGVPESLHNIFEIKLTEAMSLPLDETKERTLSVKAFDTFHEFIERVNTIVLGNGASRNPGTKELILKVCSELRLPMVVDADALHALADDLESLTRKRIVKLILTPHEGEFARLIKKTPHEVKQARKDLAKEFALRYNLILVLKGHQTVITDGELLLENTSGNAGMATAGSGDVLAGIIGGLLAQGVSPFSAAQLGVALHGTAGDIAMQEKTQLGMIASDITECVPQAIKVMMQDVL